MERVPKDRSFSPIHWRYFLSLEEQFYETTKYVEPSLNNFETHSQSFAMLLLSAASEIDVIAKQICKRIKKQSKARNIGHYAATICAAYPELGTYPVAIPKYALELLP